VLPSPSAHTLDNATYGMSVDLWTFRPEESIVTTGTWPLSMQPMTCWSAGLEHSHSFPDILAPKLHLLLCFGTYVSVSISYAVQDCGVQAEWFLLSSA
jgi:hypothetical protein